LTWLRDWKRRALEETLTAGEEGKFEAPSPSYQSSLTTFFTYADAQHPDADNEPDWMIASAREQKRNLLLQERVEREARLTRIREKEEKARLRFESGGPPNKRQVI